MTRNFVPFSWGVALGVAVCFGSWVIAFFVGLAGYAGFIPTYSAYVWRSSLIFLLPGLQDHPFAAWSVLTASVAANSLLYGCVFVLARLLVHRLWKWRSNV
jgi:hypothetical protein